MHMTLINQKISIDPDYLGNIYYFIIVIQDAREKGGNFMKINRNKILFKNYQHFYNCNNILTSE